MSADVRQPRRLGILLTHPVQYLSPLFRELARRPQLEARVFYGFRPDAAQQGTGFGVPFQWDVSLLDGYEYEFLRNRSRRPGFHFTGCDTPEIAGIIGSGRYDAWLIHGWHSRSYWQAMAACRRHGVPMIVRGDSHLLDHRSWHRRLVKRLTLSRVIPRFSAYLTVGTLNEAYYEYYGADRSRFYRAGHFVDNDWFRGEAERAAARRDERHREWGVRPGSLVVLFSGKFIEKKRPRDVIDAIEILQGLPVHLLMVGDGPLREQCERRVAERNLPVTFVGFQNQSAMPAAYAAADLLVLPSTHDETWGLVVNEAMACGLPAVVSDHVGCGPDLVTPGETGAIVPAGDVPALAAAIRSYVEVPARARSHGRAARARVAHFSVGAAADQLVAATIAVAGRAA